MRILLALCFLFSLSAHGAEYRVVCTDFEGMSLGAAPPSPWDTEDNTTPEVIQNGADGGAPHTGTRQLELASLSNSQLTGTGIQTSHINIGSMYTDEFMIDVWQRFDTNYPIGSGVHSSEFFNSGGGGSEWYFVTVQPGTSFQFAIQSQGTLVVNNLFPGGPGTSAAWYRIRYYYKKSTGVYKIWYNSTQTSAITPRIDGNTWNDWVPLANLGTGTGFSSPPGYAYMDDFQLFTDLNTGLGEPITSGSMSAGTANVNGSAACASAPVAPTYLPIRTELWDAVKQTFLSLLPANDKNWDANDYRLAA